MSQPTALKEVAVKASRPLIERKIDRMVLNVDALLTASGGTLLDALDKSPGVEVDPNGSLSPQGKSGVQVYINDKATQLSGEDLAAYLRSLPASAVDQIELMTNPPARYDAAGNSGVINIRIKKTRQAGFNGSLNTAINQGEFTRSSNSLNLNFRKDRWTTAINLGYNLNNNLSRIDLNRDFDPALVSSLSPHFRQQATVKRHADAYTGRLALDYEASPKTTIGIGINGLLNQSSAQTHNTSFLSAQSLDSSIVASNTDRKTFKNAGVNLNLRHEFEKGTELTADLDAIAYNSDLDQTFDNQSFLPDGTPYDQQFESGHLPTGIHIWSAKTDLTKGIFSAGLKSSYTTTDNLAAYVLNDQTDQNKSNHFLYQENVNAAYINAGKSFKRFSLQAGLRFENTQAHGHQLQQDSSFKRRYNGLFPTLFTQYKLDSAGNQQLRFNYGRRIDRPYYADLNPFLSPLDKFTYNQGNPFLKPTYSDNLQLSYSYKEWSATFGYSRITDKSDGLIQIINGYYYNKPGNIGRTDVETIEFEGGSDLYTQLSFHLYSRLMWQHTVTDFYTGRLDNTGIGVFIRPQFTFRPGKDWTIQADGYYQSRITSAQFIDADRKTVNLAIAKKLSPALTLRLAGNDLFHSLRNAWQIGYLQGTTADYQSTGDTRNLILSVNYRFGKAIKDQKRHEANGADDEQNRVKN